MTSTLDPSHKQIEMWRRATGSEGGLDEYRNWVLENSMRFTAYGIHTVIVEGEAKHIRGPLGKRKISYAKPVYCIGYYPLSVRRDIYSVPV
ncbi:hypothetical protein R783_003707 [Salmonella enterica subsp. enterica serovar Typhimurium]|nr:hypothetical protein [Salmonella enterica subsp. enterica serovar Typhimurium]